MRVFSWPRTTTRTFRGVLLARGVAVSEPYDERNREETLGQGRIVVKKGRARSPRRRRGAFAGQLWTNRSISGSLVFKGRLLLLGLFFAGGKDEEFLQPPREFLGGKIVQEVPFVGEGNRPGPLRRPRPPRRRVSSAMPRAARCRVPKLCRMSGCSDRGRKQPAAHDLAPPR